MITAPQVINLIKIEIFKILYVYIHAMRFYKRGRGGF